ncbi:MAG: hypothetical protein PHT12_02220 [Patescibacteria group bacterium]|nr:hypothetical protein [Patescibacteria group bacterium]
MRKNIRLNLPVISLAVVFLVILLVVLLSPLADSSKEVRTVRKMKTGLKMDVRTGEMRNRATAITKSAENLVAIADKMDTKYLFSGEPMSSLRFYKEGDATYSLAIGVGDDAVEMPAYYFEPGNYTVINTDDSDGCTTLTVEQCRANAYFLGEITFSVEPNSVVIKPVTPTPMPR